MTEQDGLCRTWSETPKPGFLAPRLKFNNVAYAQASGEKFERTTSQVDDKIEPVHEKTNNLGVRPGPTQTRLYSHRSRLEA